MAARASVILTEVRDFRLGDVIDDFCVKCRRLTNHAIVSLLEGQAAKVRCRTCYSDHDYRHEQAPPPKVDPRKAALFNQVLAKVGGTPEVPEAAKALLDGEPIVVPELDGVSEAVAASEPEAEVAPAPAKPAAKAAKRGRAK